MTTCKICIAQWDRNESANFSTINSKHAYDCVDFWSIGRLNLIWDANSDDQIAFKIECWVPGNWSAPIITSITPICNSVWKVTDNEKTGFCSKDKPNNIYYGWASTCQYVQYIWSRWEPIIVPWFEYSSKITQTCE
jgi:hypothetical protein